MERQVSDWDEFLSGRTEDDALAQLSSDPALAGAVDHVGCTLLMTAAASGWRRLAAELLRLGADPNVYGSDGCYPLHLAIDADDIDMVRMLLAAGAHPTNPFLARGSNRPPNVWWNTALCHAAALGRVRIASVLIEAPADVNAGDDDNVTPLHSAAASGNEEMIRLLLSAGADPNARDVQTEGTPADWAAARGQSETFERIARERRSP